MQALNGGGVGGFGFRFGWVRRPSSSSAVSACWKRERLCGGTGIPSRPSQPCRTEIYILRNVNQEAMNKGSRLAAQQIFHFAWTAAQARRPGGVVKVSTDIRWNFPIVSVGEPGVWEGKHLSKMSKSTGRNLQSIWGNNGDGVPTSDHMSESHRLCVIDSVFIHEPCPPTSAIGRNGLTVVGSAGLCAVG